MIYTKPPRTIFFKFTAGYSSTFAFNQQAYNSRNPAIIMRIISFIFLLTIISTISHESTADTSYIDSQMVNNEKITPKEVALMDPVCRLILIEKPGIHLRKNMSGREILSSPQYEMAKDAPFLHHRCWALIAKQRYFSTTDKGKKAQHLGAFNGDMNYVINNAPKGWKYLPQIYTEVGQMNLLLRFYSAAILSANKAINSSRSHIDAYVLLSDAYRGLGGSENQAKKYILEGLAIEPGNKQLMNRATRLKLSIPAHLTTPAQSNKEDILPSAPTPTEDNSAKQVTVEKSNANSVTAESAALPTSLQPQNENPKEPNKDVNSNPPQRRNPYCRFCPD